MECLNSENEYADGLVPGALVSYKDGYADDKEFLVVLRLNTETLILEGYPVESKASDFSLRGYQPRPEIFVELEQAYCLDASYAHELVLNGLYVVLSCDTTGCFSLMTPTGERLNGFYSQDRFLRKNKESNRFIWLFTACLFILMFSIFTLHACH